jgi:ribosomal protein S18 acetylase RimI-like enzyme
VVCECAVEDASPIIYISSIEMPVLVIRTVYFSAQYVTQVQALVKEALGELYDTSLFVNMDRSWHEGQMLALDDDRVVGFLVSVISYQEKVRILLFGIAEPWRGKGVAQMMMRAYIANCRRLKFREITLEVRMSNARAMKFYTSLGFATLDRIPAYYPDGEDGYVMTLVLRPEEYDQAPIGQGTSFN